MPREKVFDRMKFNSSIEGNALLGVLSPSCKERGGGGKRERERERRKRSRKDYSHLLPHTYVASRRNIARDATILISP